MMSLGLGLGLGLTSTRPPAGFYTIPAAETKEGKERLQAYYVSLGRFVDMFSRVETAITLTLWHYAKTDAPIAKVIFSGTKIEVGAGYIKQLAEATGVPQTDRDDLEYVLQQATIINGVRNHVLHYGAQSVAEGNAIVSNALKAKGEPTWFPLSPDILDWMTGDLSKIAAHLNYKHLKQRLPGRAQDRDEIARLLRIPWQYKHPAPPQGPSTKGRDQQTQRRGPKQPRQPRPSAA